MTKRLFISITLPAEWQDALVEYYRQFLHSDVQWTPKENMHITVCFLGDVKEEHISEIQERIKELCVHATPFSLAFKKMSFAPPEMPPRMVWAVFQESDAYTQLVKDAREIVRDFLHAQQHEEIIPHVTLARFKDPTLAEEIDIVNMQPKAMPFDVRSIELMESCFGPTGVQYKRIETFLFAKNS